jgi:hypothetical protein
VTFSFEDHRRPDGSIHLQDSYRSLYGNHYAALHYLADIEKLERVTDPGVAAVTMSTAWAFYSLKITTPINYPEKPKGLK